MVFRWKEDLKKSSRKKAIYRFIISDCDDLPIKKNQDALVISSRLRGIIQTQTDFLRIKDRDHANWSRPEEDFFRIMAFDPEQDCVMKELKEDTLRKVAITLDRSMQNCRFKWQELIQQTHSFSEKTTQQSPVTVSDRFKAHTLQLNEWESAMIALWIEKLEQIDLQQISQRKFLSTYCYDIAKSFLPVEESDLISSLSYKLQIFLSRAQEHQNPSLSRDRSEAPWLSIERQFLQHMLSDRKNAKENLATALSLLGRAPVDAVLNIEYLKALKVPDLEEVSRKLFDSKKVDGVEEHDDTSPKTVKDRWKKRRIDHRGLCKRPFTLRPQESDSKKSVDDTKMRHLMTSTATARQSEVSSMPSDENGPGEWLPLSSLSSPTLDHLPQREFETTTSTAHFSSTARQTVTPSPLFSNEERSVKRRLSSLFNSMFDWTDPDEKQMSTEKPFLTQEEEKMLEEQYRIFYPSPPLKNFETIEDLPRLDSM